MTEEKKPAKKAIKKPIKYIAKKTLFLATGRVNKGDEFTCTDEDLKALKANGAV